MKFILFSLLAVTRSILCSQIPQNPLIPPLSPVRNVTGALNNFLEQVQEMAPAEAPPVIIMGNPRASQILPLPLQLPLSQPLQTALPQPQPQLQQQPIIDPALQRLLNSFNTVPVDYAHPQQVAYSVANHQPQTIVSYVTCYVGCSHVTNVVSDASILKPSLLGTILTILVTALIL